MPSPIISPKDSRSSRYGRSSTPTGRLSSSAFTAAVLYLPKLLGIITALRDRRVRQGCGGARVSLNSLAVEVVLSALLSPIMMLIQSRFVADVFLGRDSGWNAQTRDDVGISL